MTTAMVPARQPRPRPLSRDDLFMAGQAVYDAVLEQVQLLQQDVVSRDDILEVARAIYDAMLDTLKPQLAAMVDAVVDARLADQQAALNRVANDLATTKDILQTNIDSICQNARMELADAQRQQLTALSNLLRALPVPTAEVYVSPELRATLTMPKRVTHSEQSILYDEVSGLPMTMLKKTTEEDAPGAQDKPTEEAKHAADE